MTIFAISAGVLATVMVYVVMKVSHFGESKVLGDELLKAKADADASKKKLAGYTQYAEGLEAARQSVVDRLRAPAFSVMRDYTHVEVLAKSKYGLKSEATVVVKYSVEFAFSVDTGTSGLTVAAASNGVSMTIRPPTLVGDPKIKTVSHQLIGAAELPDKQLALADIQALFAPLAYRYGQALCAEEAVRALCTLKAEHALRDALAQQTGVRHLPGIFCSFK